MTAFRWAMGAALLSALLASHAAVAQERFSTITGTVVDESGAGIPGVSVTLTHLETKRTIARTTDADGSYAAREIEPGRYVIRCELSGFATTEVADVNLLLGKTLKIPTTLKVGALTETVQVLGESSAHRHRQHGTREQHPRRGVRDAAQGSQLRVAGGHRPFREHRPARGRDPGERRLGR